MFGWSTRKIGEEKAVEKDSGKPLPVDQTMHSNIVKNVSHLGLPAGEGEWQKAAAAQAPTPTPAASGNGASGAPGRLKHEDQYDPTPREPEGRAGPG